MTDILQKIAADKRIEVAELSSRIPLSDFIDDLSSYPVPLFKDALINQGKPNIIAEIKKGSPSRGIIKHDFDPKKLAQEYCCGGACALSVLTEQKYFFGNADYMAQAKEISGLPVLCKDFVVDQWQLYYAKKMGADAVLLIVSLQSKEVLAEYLKTARSIKVDCLVEVHDESQLDIALSAGAGIIGVNNRNLIDFSISLEISERLAKIIPQDIIKVSESGIFKGEDIVRLRDSGFNNFLIGEALMRSESPSALIKDLRSV